MALTPSSMVDLGSKAPYFNLPDVVSEQEISYEEVSGEQGTVVMFICNHCPFVKHVNDELVRVANDYQERGVSFVAISSNDATTHPQDSPEQMKEVAKKHGYSFPYLYDETQEVAQAYQATCTPDFFVYDADDKLVYRGQLDDSRPNNGKPVTGADLREALDTLLAGDEPVTGQQPSIGCNIKWKN